MSRFHFTVLKVIVLSFLCFIQITNCLSQNNCYLNQSAWDDENTIKELLKGGLSTYDNLLWDFNQQHFVSSWPNQITYKKGKNRTVEVQFSEVYISKNQLLSANSPKDYLMSEIQSSSDYQDNSRDRGILKIHFDELGRMVNYDRSRTDGDTMFVEEINRNINYLSDSGFLNQIEIETHFKTEFYYNSGNPKVRRDVPGIEKGKSDVRIRINKNSLIDEVEIENTIDSDGEIEKNKWSTFYVWDEMGRPKTSKMGDKKLTNYAYRDTSFNLAEVIQKHPLVQIPCISNWLSNFDSNRLSLTTCNTTDFIILDQNKALMQLNPPNSSILGQVFYEIADSTGLSKVSAEIDSAVNLTADCIDFEVTEDYIEPEFPSDYYYDYNSKHFLKSGQVQQTDYDHHILKNGWHFYSYKKGSPDFRSDWFSIGKRVTSQFRTKTYVITDENGLVQYVSLNNELYRFKWN